MAETVIPETELELAAASTLQIEPLVLIVLGSALD